MVKRIIIHIIKVYQLIGPFVFIRTCRFTPTCSHYAIEAISKKGVVSGLKLAMVRIFRCHPFSKPSYDPVR